MQQQQQHSLASAAQPQLVTLARSTLEDKAGASPPEHYFKELIVFARDHPHDTNFIVELSPAGEGYGIATCNENGCFQDVPLAASRFVPDGGLSVGLGGLEAYSNHILLAPSSHAAARDARIKARAAEDARRGIKPAPPLFQLGMPLQSYPAPALALAGRPPYAATYPSLLPPGANGGGQRPSSISRIEPSQQAVRTGLSGLGIAPQTIPLTLSGSNRPIWGPENAPTGYRTFGVVPAPTYGRQAVITLNSSEGSSSSSSSSPGPWTPASSVQYDQAANILRSSSSESDDIKPKGSWLLHAGPARSRKSEIRTFAIDGSDDVKPGLGQNPLAFVIQQDVKPRVKAEPSGSGSGPRTPTVVNRPAFNIDEIMNAGLGANAATPGFLNALTPDPYSDVGYSSSADKFERDRRARRARIQERRIRDFKDEGSDSDHAGRDEVEEEPLPMTLDDFTRQSLAGTGYEEDTDMGKAREALGLPHPDSFISGTNIKPYPYQCIGIHWCLQKENAKKYRGGIVADEMGLGKTCTMISVMALNPPKNRKRKTTLIIAPLALLTQWREELEEKTDQGTYKILTYHGPQAKRKHKTYKDLEAYDVILTTYGTLTAEWIDPKVREAKDIAKDDGPLFFCRFHRIILDEAQIIRNPRAQASKAVAELSSTYRWCLTGTPLCNTLDDAFPYLRFLRIKKWSKRQAFRDSVTKLEKKAPQRASLNLSSILRPIMIRRTKKSKFHGKDILVLPKRHLDDVKVDLSLDERQIYDAFEGKMQVQFNKFLKEGTVMRNYASVLTMLLYLRMCCDHPCLIMEQGALHAWEDPTTELQKNTAELHKARTMPEIGPEWVERVQKKLRDKAVQRVLMERAGNGDTKEVVAEDECAICMDPMLDPMITKCEHIYCKECITNHVNSHPAGDVLADEDGRTCPLCRAPLNINELFRVAAFEPTQIELDNLTGRKRKASKSPRKQQQQSNSSKNKKTDPIFIDSDEEEDALPDLPSVKKEGATTRKGKEGIKKEEEASDEEEEVPIKRSRMETSVSVNRSPFKAINFGGKARTGRKSVNATSKAGKRGRAVTRSSRNRKNADEEDEDDDNDSDDMADFIVDDDEDPYASPPARDASKRKRKDKGKGRARDSDEDDDVENDFAAASEAEASDVEAGLDVKDAEEKERRFQQLDVAKLMPKFMASSKMVVMFEEIKRLHTDPKTRKDKIIVISQFTSMLDLCGNYLSQEGFFYTEYDGRLNLSDKDEAIRSFKKDSKIKIMLLSLRAGGVGLNLTVANHVISLDLAYNTAVENQAFDRTHRIGQGKEVYIKRLVVANTVEDRILALQERKNSLIDGAIGDKSLFRPGRLTVNDLRNLFNLGADGRARPAEPLVRRPNPAAARANGEGAANNNNNNNADGRRRRGAGYRGPGARPNLGLDAFDGLNNLSDEDF